MFELVVMPLTALWAGESEAEEGFEEALSELQELLGKEAGHEVVWSETQVEEEEEVEGDAVDPYCIYGLRAAAAWIEFCGGSLEGFSVGDEPWDHEALDRFDESGRSKEFPQLLHSDDAGWTAFAPVAMPDVFVMVGEDDVPAFSVGSAVGLRAELDKLRGLLGIEAGVEVDLDDVVIDPTVDPLAGPRYGWLVLSARVNEALEKKLPLIVFDAVEDDDEYFEDDGEDDGEDDDEDDGDDSADNDA